ncbi:2-oxoglutarate dehydrogenase E2 component (dihydrolipoamide succinyltransferase) [Chitinophaga terrae (ex Kim and Jung 2007)]|uniref:Dihydrolipoamide acetyltransferase component of pyruvate dehydrogenase complex n=1 Tax=Chitinophaga terrae (ex Kim and Jung 2007) TaxID=408074 RepID=A0A1H4BI25_9BACT|nr:dihydrolipoamide acetyltransferase family protein [Chitinophaga terrae (ex Kim and Jung 2007)]MDQ0109332.1 2-oxoglutarate dehydrogenase E2 component (dihydrolipoamide succinyltransferase) [Chitinophaga terrae (ex Kim and Jung 2007)]GEP89572.1 dihydrolipoamide acetyltransferase component of pyruvate dehydrogenase complex [Chitinophaga terrae (ex Kim and Jung 2007)]SEA47829.1 2-oxoglutarate dehydrogenase E2 component (dihydrolipoamide succinyltransferase) [Chitinophaga terrae (ex Kim and Jung 2
MAIVELVMPKMGESIMEATILRWHKKAGDHVKVDETVLEIATDKVDSEVPSNAEGEITEVLFNENDVVPVGTVIARIRTNAEEGASTAPSQPAAPAVSTPEQTNAPAPASAPAAEQHHAAAAAGSGPKFYSPLVLTIAQQEGVSFADLEKIPGSGNDGRVTKKDILQYVADRKEGKIIPDVTPAREAAPAPAVQPVVTTTVSSPTYSGNVEIVEMDRMRKLIANHMVMSKQTSPHVTSFAEADVTNMVKWRERVKGEFEKREGEKLTFTPLFIEAIVKCIKRFPLINCSLDGDKIIIKKDINIGMATALPSGNLIVPVIKNADVLNLVGITKQVNHLANAARQNKLKPEDTQSGTFTLTNVGTFGSLMGTPIINQPQVAILAVGAIKKRPVVIETPDGDTIGIRHMMYLSMSYDHRIVDGSLGATFLTAVAQELENFDPKKSF